MHHAGRQSEAPSTHDRKSAACPCLRNATSMATSGFPVCCNGWHIVITADGRLGRASLRTCLVHDASANARLKAILRRHGVAAMIDWTQARHASRVIRNRRSSSRTAFRSIESCWSTPRRNRRSRRCLRCRQAGSTVFHVRMIRFCTMRVLMHRADRALWN